MCGGAIISDFLPAAHRSRRLTADFLWSDLKRPGAVGVAAVDGFDADFRGFDKDESGDDVGDGFDDGADDADAKPFAFPAAAREPGRRSGINPVARACAAAASSAAASKTRRRDGDVAAGGRDSRCRSRL